MSRIGKAPVEIPQGVTIAVQGQAVTCKGPLGTLKMDIKEGVNAKVEGNQVIVGRTGEEKTIRSQHGTTRALIANMVEGVTKGFKKQLEIVGVGYKAVLAGKKVALTVGFANTIEVAIPDGVKVEIPDPNHVNITGLDKHKVGQMAADLREIRKPEPYKGKGVRYMGEVVRKKAGKQAATSGAGAAKK
jgi:large subunit ribosomal protein L6